jgi:hypothetical protein
MQPLQRCCFSVSLHTLLALMMSTLAGSRRLCACSARSTLTVLGSSTWMSSRRAS